MKQTKFAYEFVEYIPDHLVEGTIYISINFATATHKCSCGCGNEVVTPLSPTDWKLIFDGESVTLDPSIGNWNFPCQSHYWIKRNKVTWANQWSQDQIDNGRNKNLLSKQNQLNQHNQKLLINEKPNKPKNILQKIVMFLRG
jgi:hypothetical protein